ncbi:hypothetical protein MOK15_10335 [Sphingobium sp. BYY-5]|uniref:hypothetical protein n=1 Tax=Sphingobium sp. BYY-5 TaxID=2926400 RepID=UPI001FA8115A|nr:hypothetical protein [Sphingobium sp. BYY-5]MCI4590493.1 hypothetical protein [Sphingobium sp. BYY-5]
MIGLLAWAGVAMATPAHSAVTGVSENGFATESRVEIAASAEAVYLRGGSAKLAPLVDQLLAEQLAGLKRVAESDRR